MRCVAEQRFVQHVCLRNPFPLFLLGIRSSHFLPEAGSWERQHTPPAMHSGFIMPIPSLHLQKKDLSNAEKQSVWSRSCGLQDLLQYSDCALSCATWLVQTNEQLSSTVDIELLATAGWKCGCQPFSCRCSQNVTHCRTEICSTCLFKESIPAIPFWDFQASTPYQKQVPERGRTLHHVCIRVVMPIPSLHLQKKDLSNAEKQSVCSRSCGLQDLLQYSDCALSCALWLVQTNEQLSTLSF